ncbi:Thiopurine S-methyltransferase [Hyella patelloides LEGE 07179]|uniref:Thiopurine S-methyltransferase n=1 Tax=Hyella patelloides LEGE 07179 TaxID=945734 RepID=A0A563VUZ3_9CYAN|nr:thiopurine S-methyltransferase [Hyella patelloides]VEP15257.1 Thiopurine S-methyltransferase [Hyella patelloides LEGE 07179]
MDSSFWLQKWEKNDIGFHKSEANPVLAKYFEELSLSKGSRLFVPLCGKTLDIAWLLLEGYRVTGAELVEMAVEQLFDELGMKPKISRVGEASLYSAKDINIFVGNILDVSGEILGSVDAIYDRAALVALPEEMRNRYTAHLAEITGKAPQLLVTYEYDQNLMEGPPFSISNEEVERHYSDSYDLSLIVSTDVAGGLKGKCAAKENVWLLQKHQ